MLRSIHTGYWIGGAVGLLLIALALFSMASPVKAPTVNGGTATSTSATSTPGTATSTGKTISAGSQSTTTPSRPKAVYMGPFPVNTKDTIASWSLKGAYSGNTTLEQKANADITHLKSLLNTGKYSNYILYNGIGNDYVLLGNGSAAYNAYNSAAKADPGQGLTYTNLANLFEQLGAYYTAADAYKKAVTVEPGMLVYHLDQIKYLVTQFPNQTTAIQAAISSAYAQFGDTAAVLMIEAQWLEGRGDYANAIKAWKRAALLMPGYATTSIAAAIARDEAKLQ